VSDPVSYFSGQAQQAMTSEQNASSKQLQIFTLHIYFLGDEIKSAGKLIPMTRTGFWFF
jgi:hypothetical protein